MGKGCNFSIGSWFSSSSLDYGEFGIMAAVVDYKQLRLEAKEDKRNRHITEVLTGKRCPCKNDVLKLLKGGI